MSQGSVTEEQGGEDARLSEGRGGGTRTVSPQGARAQGDQATERGCGGKSGGEACSRAAALRQGEVGSNRIALKEKERAGYHSEGFALAAQDRMARVGRGACRAEAEKCARRWGSAPLPSARRPLHLAAADDVQVEVVHALAAIRAVVDHDPEALVGEALLVRHHLCGVETAGKQAGKERALVTLRAMRRSAARRRARRGAR